MKTTFNLYLFSSEESATLFKKPVLKNVNLNIENINIIQLKEIILNCINPKYNSLPNDFEKLSFEKLLEYLSEELYLYFDRAAIISSEFENCLIKHGNALFKQFGNDTEIYEACGEFAEILMDKAVKIIPFPIYKEEN